MPRRSARLSPTTAHTAAPRMCRWSCRRSTPTTSRSSPHSASVWAPSAALSPSSPTARLQSYVPALHPTAANYGVTKVLACTYQAISGAGKTFETFPDILDNVIPYIGGEEEKSRAGAAEAVGPYRGRQDLSTRCHPVYHGAVPARSGFRRPHGAPCSCTL